MEKIILEQISAVEFIDKTVEKILERIKDVVPKPKNEDQFLTCKQATKLLQVSLPTLHIYCESGLIPSYRIGRNIRFKKSELEEIIDQGLRFKVKKKTNT